nr:hypothetical protein [Tanacetum cinerariifolium]
SSTKEIVGRSREERDYKDDWDHLLDFNLDDVPLLCGEELLPFKDKVKLDGKIVKEEEKAIQRIKGEALKEKDNPEVFIFPIRLEGKVNKNALANIGSDINTMSYRIYETLGREEMKKVDRGITMINIPMHKLWGYSQVFFVRWDDWDHLLDFNLDDVPLLCGEELLPFKDKVKLDGKIVKEEEKAIQRIKGEALKEKDNPEVFIFPIRLEGKVNKNALA